MPWNEEIKKVLGSCGENVFIGPSTIFTCPERVHLDDRVRIDPFCLITTGLETGSNIQICSHVVLSGGRNHTIYMDNWTFIGYHSMLFCGSEDYSGDAGPVNDFWGRNKVYHGDIKFEEYSGVASGVTIMPGIILPMGCTIGAHSFVYKNDILEPWSVLFGNPLRLHKRRNKEQIIISSSSQDYLKDPR